MHTCPAAHTRLRRIGALLGIAFFALVCWVASSPPLLLALNEFEVRCAARCRVAARFLSCLGASGAFNYLLLAMSAPARHLGKPPRPPRRDQP